MSDKDIIDAQAALGFVESQTSHIEREVNETVYPDIQYPLLIPVDTSAHPLAKTVTYYSADKFGKADWINGNSDDIPLAGTEREQHQTEVYTAAIGYDFGYEEVNHAQMLGINLPADSAKAARRAYEEMVDGVALSGDPTKNFEGLFNHSSVTASAAATGDWSTASAEDILGDVNAVLEGVGAETAYTALADTLILPKSVSQYLSTPMPGTTMPVLEYIMQYNTYTMQTRRPLTLRFMRGLDTAGVSNSKRMVAYRRDDQVLKLHIPMPHRFLPVYQAGPLYFVVPGIFRLGGLDIRRPKEIRYGDGI